MEKNLQKVINQLKAYKYQKLLKISSPKTIGWSISASTSPEISLKPKASNGHRFIFVAVDYFTKWVEVSSFMSVNKKVLASFVKHYIYRIWLDFNLET